MNNMKQGVFGTPATLNFWHDEQFIDGIDWNQNPVHLAAKVRDELENIAKEYFGLPTDCVTADGVTAEDSPIRRTSIITWSPWAKETRNHIRPIYDWKVADVRKAIESNNVKVPADYVIWGRSHDGIDYRFLYNIKAKFPADYEKIKHFYPLIDVELLKYNEQVALIPPKGYK
jgi:hypothetical protein